MTTCTHIDQIRDITPGSEWFLVDDAPTLSYASEDTEEVRRVI
jgi:hypothetical protein